ncbi:hypothetical protein BDV28DRAFT_145567 [Aspergillus coremiiformis]|uniref:Uncharacterized protein n=1 Tax=Aspergillus coremiiformis TaxID=138285 RepID=A0A5N6ZFA2_9EURO|nr:hypothetical protein BDV28DRAFT_145567 [Aspergillus coremiiformis]
MSSTISWFGARPHHSRSRPEKPGKTHYSFSMETKTKPGTRFISYTPDHFGYSKPSSISFNSESGDSRLCSLRKNSSRERRESVAVDDLPSSRDLVVRQQDADQQELESLRRELRDAQTQIRRQEIQLFRLQLNRYADHQYPDTVIAREYQSFLLGLKQAAWSICDIMDYDVDGLCLAIRGMVDLEDTVGEENTSSQLVILMSLIQSPSYSKAFHRSAVAMVVFLSLERWAFSPRNISVSISPREDQSCDSSFNQIFQWLLSDVQNDYASDPGSVARLKHAEEWRLDTVLCISRAQSAAQGRDLRKQKIIQELCQLFPSRDDSPQVQSVLDPLVDSAIALARFLQEQKSIYHFVRPRGRFDPESMRIEKSLPVDLLHYQRDNAEVRVCIYPSLVKIISSSPFIFHVSQGNAICGPVSDSEMVDKELVLMSPRRRQTT